MKKELKFSVSLGLFDYINPILYFITTFTIIRNLNWLMIKPLYIFFIIGACISLFFGLCIPTVKLLVGLDKIKFKMPVNLVFYVNIGILLSGICLLETIFNLRFFIFPLIIGVLLLLLIIYLLTKKFNTVAVMTGSIGYIFIYISLITYAFRNSIFCSVILYALAICFFLALCVIGIKANLKDPKIHWILEISNVLCQGLVAVSTLLLFL